MVKCKIYLIERFGPRAVGRIVAVLDRSMRERPPNQGVLTPLLGDYDGVARQEHDVLFHPLGLGRAVKWLEQVRLDVVQVIY